MKSRLYQELVEAVATAILRDGNRPYVIVVCRKSWLEQVEPDEKRAEASARQRFVDKYGREPVHRPIPGLLDFMTIPVVLVDSIDGHSDYFISGSPRSFPEA